MTTRLPNLPSPSGDTAIYPAIAGPDLAPAPAAPFVMVPKPRALEGRVRDHSEIPRPMRDQWAALPEAARAKLKAAVDADPVAAFADRPPAELAEVAVDSYVARLHAIGRELEVAVDAVQVNAELTRAERLADKVKLEDRAAASAAQLRTARDMVLASLEAGAKATIERYDNSLWAVPPVIEQIARERWAEATKLGTPAVQQLFAGVSHSGDEASKLALLRIVRSEIMSKAEEMKTTTDLAKARAYAPLVSLVDTFEAAVRPVAVAHAHDAIAAVRRARTDSELIDGIAYKRVERARV